ncbi:tetratricopeptide repeat protein [Kiloniella sp. EL199]|uniref:tetratricopeptide repeat protein n=1 Tax=Kiloniella sp. EL199 TaxID=2107581 RepID=UPI000EA3E5D9|nr:tetratricopeptide repeat protein [Kiloniella sp. EL199]
MADIFQEVEEDLKRERVEVLWKKYGKWAIGVAVLVVAAAAGFQGWESYKSTVQTEKSATFASALELIQGGKAGEGTAKLTSLAQDDDGYGTLARFEQARLLVEANDTVAAVKIWDEVAASNPPLSVLKDVAALLAAMHLVESGDIADVKQRLASLAVANGAFRYSAIELQAMVALREGDLAAAKALFQQLVDATDTPNGIKSRSGQILESLAE